MTTTLMMKDILFNFKDYNDGYVLYMIYQEYERYNSVNISELWRQKYFLDDKINEYNNNMILSLIRKYAPDIYDTYKYDFDDEIDIYDTNLNLCCDILKRRFNDIFSNVSMIQKVMLYQMLILILNNLFFFNFFKKNDNENIYKDKLN